MSATKPLSQLSSREYKLMLEPLMFDGKRSIRNFADEFVSVVNRCGAELKGEAQFHKSAEREIEFLDSKDSFFRRNNFVLRHRYNSNGQLENELTLKCRAADPFLVLGTKFRVPEANGKAKLEEDICPPFISRLSRSVTVPCTQKPPRRYSECENLFPGLRTHLTYDGNFPVSRVNDTLIHEEVLVGPKFTLGDRKSESALILWRHSPNGRIALVELSFRYKVGKLELTRDVACQYLRLFELTQSMGWSSSASMTKTAYLYGTHMTDK